MKFSFVFFIGVTALVSADITYQKEEPFYCHKDVCWLKLEDLLDYEQKEIIIFTVELTEGINDETFETLTKIVTSEAKKIIQKDHDGETTTSTTTEITTNSESVTTDENDETTDENDETTDENDETTEQVEEMSDNEANLAILPGEKTYEMQMYDGEAGYKKVFLIQEPSEKHEKGDMELKAIAFQITLKGHEVIPKKDIPIAKLVEEIKIHVEKESTLRDKIKIAEKVDPSPWLVLAPVIAIASLSVAGVGAVLISGYRRRKGVAYMNSTDDLEMVTSYSNGKDTKRYYNSLKRQAYDVSSSPNTQGTYKYNGDIRL